MIDVFENLVRTRPDSVCFTFIDESGGRQDFTYREARLMAGALAQRLRECGVERGDCVAVDLPNRPECVLLLLAAGYGGFTLVMLNHRLAAEEKATRLAEIGRLSTESLRATVDLANVEGLMADVRAVLYGEGSQGRDGARRGAHDAPVTLEGHSARPRERTHGGRDARRRRDELARQDAVSSVIHYVERAARSFDRGKRAAVMFTSGTTGRPKAVPLTWDNLCRSAEAANASLGGASKGLWQAVLPLCHVGGLQVVVRSILNRRPFLLYRRFDAQLVLDDARRCHATHLPVVDKTLQDLLATRRFDELRAYECILLGGGALNSTTVERVKRAGLRVFASYGMTETCSQIANALVTPAFDGGLQLMDGYEARIVDPDRRGFGGLAVRGPSVVDGYLNARAVKTADGFFMTGDSAALRNGLLYLEERVDDMFVSGGENVYPAEIRERLLHVPGVADAHVFGAPDSTWGRRPVAFVEREKPQAVGALAADGSGGGADGAGEPGGAGGAGGACGADEAPALSDRAFAAQVTKSLSLTLSKINMPSRVFVVEELPRQGIGKIDRRAVERSYHERIEVAHVTLYRIRVPFVKPFKTPKGTLRNRESLLVEVTDREGRTGLGECVAFRTDWYLPEVLGSDLEVLRDVLAPAALGETFLHPREASRLFAGLPRAQALPMARGAIEPALWDLYGKICGKPLWQLLADEFQLIGAHAAGGKHAATPEDALESAGDAGEADGSGADGAGATAARGAHAIASTPAGAVVGLGSVSETSIAVRRCVEAGYERIKLKVAPGNAAARVRAARAAAPDAMITLDANQSFRERDLKELHELDSCGAAWIEEPLDLRRLGGEDPFERLARLQGELQTPICLDESIVTPADLERALSHLELRCYAVKVGKLGGVEPTLEFLDTARARGIDVWMGGMYDTGVSKRLHAAFQMLPGVDAPGDIGAASRYFATDVTDPPYEVSAGQVQLNQPGHETGLGCSLNRQALAQVLVDRIDIG